MNSQKKIFLIAEIGINHNGSVDIAKKIILQSKKAGFDAVKFQKRDPDICVPENKKKDLKETPWGLISYIEYKKKIEFNKKQYLEIDKFCKKNSIIWFASSWDIPSQKFLNQFNLKYNKVASAMITNIDLIKFIAKQKKMTFISTGMSDYKQIDYAIKIFKKNNCKFTLLHSVSEYPCPEDRLNLSLIPILKKKYKCPIGYSGHESSVSPSLIAASLGAIAVERHVTLSRSMWGTDQSSSLELNGMITLNQLIRKFEVCIGNGKKKITAEVKKKLDDQKYW
jgi:N-acetylneuraminate synthase